MQSQTKTFTAQPERAPESIIAPDPQSFATHEPEGEAGQVQETPQDQEKEAPVPGSPSPPLQAPSQELEKDREPNTLHAERLLSLNDPILFDEPGTEGVDEAVAPGIDARNETFSALDDSSRFTWNGSSIDEIEVEFIIRDPGVPVAYCLFGAIGGPNWSSYKNEIATALCIFTPSEWTIRHVRKFAANADIPQPYADINAVAAMSSVL